MALLLALTLTACKKKVAGPAPPEPPKPPVVQEVKKVRPSITTFEGEPRTIERGKGQSATLRWAVTGDIDQVTITPGIGTVDPTGTRQVFPNQTTTYTLTARGPAGEDSRTVTINVTEPAPPPPPPPPQPKRTISQALDQDVKDAFFDYDKSNIREDARITLTRNGDALKQIMTEFSGASVNIEGHADERGSSEYNLGLSDRRATAAKEFLQQLGVDVSRLKIVAFGKDKPQCTESNEDCWQKNRRAHFAPGN